MHEKGIENAICFLEALNPKILKTKRRWSGSTITFQRKRNETQVSNGTQLSLASPSFRTLPNVTLLPQMIKRWLLSTEQPHIRTPTHTFPPQTLNNNLVLQMASAAGRRQMWPHKCVAMTHGLEEWGRGCLTGTKGEFVCWNALGMRIPTRSSRESLCLNPRESWGHLQTFQTSVLLQGR